MTITFTPHLAEAGVAAVKAGKYVEGIEKLTEALKERAAPVWHLERSKAYLRTKQFDLALYDAEMALRIAFDRANRQQMAEAQLRRAITFFRMGRFADADVCAFWAIRLSDGARAHEDDGQQNKVDGNGDYAVGVEEVHNAAKPPDREQPSHRDGMAAALNPASMQTKESRLRNEALSWRLQALTRMEELAAGDDGRKPHVSAKYPEPSQPSTTGNAPHSPSATANVGGDAGGESSNTDNAPNATSGRGAWKKLWGQYYDMYAQQKIRCSFYQTETSLTVDIFLKNLSPEQVAIDSEQQVVKINPAQAVSLGSFSGPIVLLLFGQIKPEATKYNVKSMKIELILQKKTAGKWPTLRCDNADIVDNLSISPSQGVSFDQFFDFITTLGYKDTRELELPDFDSDHSVWYAVLLEKLRSNMYNGRDSSSAPEIDAPTSTVSIPSLQPKDPAEKVTAVPDGENVAAKTSSSAPAYPTSSRKGPKNWDNIDDGDDEDPSKNGDVNSFFQQIYKDADEDTKRAMMKSFVESNGTALSTSWSDAKSKTYKTQPPDGVEAKEWE
ncbi:SGS-domain-containing protein [Xylaria acuta]|nr:SGS-domain-containing protein [Xylaria acuta]